VRKPGVYEFTEGDRIIDAIDAAGGATSKADLQSLNLAAPVQDGVQVLVPAKAPASGTAPGGTTGSPGATGSTGALVNINTADATALEALPGIGEVLSQAIVDYRTQNGPFATVDDLENVSGIGPSIMEDVRDMVTV
jgi:competence protein ComEA